MNRKILGIHHVTAISGPAHENFKFYTETLGLRLVKRTVNFDDPGVYHLYYGDQTGSPGTLMTFFPYGGSQGDKGTGQVAASSYPVRDLEMWKKRLDIPYQVETRFGDEYVVFEDLHGMALELYQSDSAPEQLGPIGGATLKLRNPEKTAELLELLGFEEKARENSRLRFGLTGSESTLDILQSNEPPTRGGAGTVHHIALRVADDEAQQYWRDKLIRAGYQASPVMDRNYFHSIYFRGPGGVLFELATDPPGMLIDESVEELGAKLLLPPQYEPHRERIEAVLDPLEEPYKSTETSGSGDLIVALHGTGGDEHDLLDLAAEVAPGRPLLGLRGNVNERGARRFFKRLREGVFDQEDLRLRAAELARFLRKKSGPRVALGYSNGANMAAAVLLQEPDSFDKAILFRPMLGWEPGPADLSGKQVLLLIGRDDRIVSPEAGEKLAEVLRDRGADVQVHRIPSGHNLTSQDITLARGWLSANSDNLKHTA